jgi:ribosomal protein S18 acetylase RimI-like enzyme
MPEPGGERPGAVAGSAVEIRRATTADAAAVAEFAARTFAETFGPDNRPEDLAEHLATAYGIPQQSTEIANPGYVTWLAHVNGVLGGFAQVRRKIAPTTAAAAAALEIHRFYVDRRWHGRGVAVPLMDACLDAARGFGGRAVWLSVWEHNPRALAFYVKRGFIEAGNADFWVGPDRQTDHILVRALD